MVGFVLQSGALCVSISSFSCFSNLLIKVFGRFFLFTCVDVSVCVFVSR